MINTLCVKITSPVSEQMKLWQATLRVQSLRLALQWGHFVSLITNLDSGTACLRWKYFCYYISYIYNLLYVYIINIVTKR